VQQFKPEELQVKITDDTISITGKHEEKQDERNFSCQEYSRKHSLPQGVKADDVKCRMSVDGILTVTAPRKVQQPALENVGRTIPIQHSAIRV
jgi:crystallin alpha B